MPDRLRTTLAWSLAVCVLLAAGVLYPLTVPHAAHHAHHTGETHATALCAWLCAAGQAVDSIAVYTDATHGPLTAVALSIKDLLRSLSLQTAQPRGPPVPTR